VIFLQARKFFCVEESCQRSIFTEHLPGTVARYSRRTFRLSEALNWITLALGGQAGALLARRLGLLVSGSTLLRHLRRHARSSPVQSPRVLGIDDWAWKKGHRYGTILCDLESHKVVDLLPDRESATVAAWLRQHPGAEIVSRDRASAYSIAAHEGVPRAVQVTDRWHLLRNLSDALRNALEPHRRTMTQAARASRSPEPISRASSPTSAPAITQALSTKQRNRERRHSLYGDMRRLAAEGATQTKIARQLDLSIRTVQRWIRAGVFPERTARSYPSAVDAYASYLDRRLLQGCHSVVQLWRELRQQGFRGCQSSVWNWLRQHRGSDKKEISMKPALRTSPQHTAWLILKQTPSAQPYLEALYRISPQISALAHIAREFFRIIRTRDLAAWPLWLVSAKGTALAGFASRLLRDQDAVRAALQLPWSNGPVEGHVHRLKLIKRQMYGRASFDLLKLRVLHPA
jgi:transposase